MQYQTGQAMREAATNPTGGGGAAGLGVGLGAGMGMGYQMIGTMQQASQPQQAQAAAVPQVACPKCGVLNPQTSKFCSGCGGKLGVAMVQCPHCKASVPEGKFCPECGKSMVVEMKKCAACGADAPTTSKFCPSCGKAL
jgi:membrane protease subunit (stomatin/prohibitin family)